MLKEIKGGFEMSLDGGLPSTPHSDFRLEKHFTSGHFFFSLRRSIIIVFKISKNIKEFLAKIDSESWERPMSNVG